MAGDLNVKVNLEARDAELQKALNDWQKGLEGGAAKLNKLLGGNEKFVKELQIKVNDQGVNRFEVSTRKVLTGIEKIEREAKKLNKVEIGSVTNIRQSLNNARQLRDSIQVLGTTIDRVSGKQILKPTATAEFLKANERVRTLTQQLRQVEQVGQTPFERIGQAARSSGLIQFGRGVQDLVGIFQSLGIAVAAVVRPINQAATALAKLQSFALTFRSTGVDAGAANAALQDSSRIALGLGVSLDTVRDGYAKLSPVILASGGNLEDVSDILESLTSRFAAFGLGADKQRRVLNGVIQAFAKGKLQAEELTQQISEADPAFKVNFVSALNASTKALKLLGVESVESVGQLEELVKAGKIVPEVFVEGLKGIKIDEIFGKLGDSARSAFEAVKAGGPTINQLRENLQTLNQLSFEKLSKSFEPLIFSLFEIQAIFSDFLTRISDSDAFQSIGRAFGDIVSGISGAADTFLRVSEVIAGFVGGITNAVQAIGDTIAPITSLGGALKGLTGPLEFVATFLGVKLIAAIVQGTAGFVKFSLEASKAAKTVVTAFNRSEKAKAIGDDVAPRVKSTTTIIEALAQKTNQAATATKALDTATKQLIKTQSQIKPSDAGQPLVPDPFNPDERGTAIVKFDENFAEAQRGLQNLENRTDDLAKGFKNAERNAQILAGQRFTAPLISVQTLNKTTNGLGATFTRVKTLAIAGFTGIANAAKTAATKIVAITRSALASVGAFLKANKSLILLTAAFIAIGKVQEAFAARNSRIKESIDPIENALKNLDQTMKDTSDIFKDFGKETPNEFEKAKIAATIFGRELTALDIILAKIVRVIKGISFAGIFKQTGDEARAASEGFTTFADRAQGALLGVGLGALGAKFAATKLAKTLIGLGLKATASGVAAKIGLALIAAGAIAGALSVGKLNEALKQTQENQVATTKAIRNALPTLEDNADEIEKNVQEFKKLEKQIEQTTDSDLKLKLRTELFLEKEKLNQQIKGLELAAVTLEAKLNIAKAQQQFKLDLLEIAKAVNNSNAFQIGGSSNRSTEGRLENLRNRLANIFNNIPQEALDTLKLKLGSLGDDIDFSNLDKFKASLRELPKSRLEEILGAFKEIGGQQAELEQQTRELKDELTFLEGALANISQRATELKNLVLDPDVQKANQELADLQQALEIAKKTLKELKIDPELPESIKALRELTESIAQFEGQIRIQTDIKQAELGFARLRQLNKEVRAGLETPIRIQLQIQATKDILDTVSITQGGAAEGLRQFYQDLQFRASTAYQTIGQLQQRLYANQIQQIQLVAQADQQRSQRAIAALDREIAAAQRYWNKRLQQVQEYVGPATKELQKLREQELREEAAKGGREGLEAQAQLEAIQKEKELKEIRKQAEKEIAQLREKRFKLQERARRKQEAFQNKITELQEKSNAIQQEALERQEAILQDIIGKRKASGEEAIVTEKSLLGFQEEILGKLDEQKETREQTTEELENQKEAAKDLAAEVAKIDEALEKNLQNVVNQISAALDGVGAKLDSIFANRTYTINVNLNVTGGPKKAGGPVVGGVPYTVNEAGQEGFLSASGKMTPIRKPAFGTFTPKDDGIIIPHHIWQDVQGSAKPSVSPRAKANVSTGNIRPSGQKDRSAQILAAAMSAMNQTNRVTRNAAKDSSAAQIKQLGKLNSAIESLAKKDWNLYTTVKAPGTNRNRPFGASF